MGSRYFQYVLQTFIRQRRALLVPVHIHHQKSLFTYAGTAKNTQRLLCKLDKVFISTTIYTSVKV